MKKLARRTAAEREKILVVEDDAALRALLEEEFRDAGLRVRTAADAAAAWSQVERWSPDLVVSDLRLPGADGLALLSRIRELAAPPAFLIMTAFGTVSQAVEALKQGADEFLTKPLDLDHLMLCTRRLLENRRLRMDVQRFREVLGSSDFHGIIGRSSVMNQLFATLKQVALATGPVLITGESGVGKDLIARAVHQESPRKQGPFIAVNCAGIPTELLESEFFGHAAGSFTGAGQARKGLFAEAEGGTLFLDEIAEMPIELQVKLLRILQDGKVRPVGANRETQIDVRIVAATNRNLEEQVRSGRFREDLYFRLETFGLHVPPLRERGEDLDLLAARFVDILSTQMEREVWGISDDALKLLRSYPFPGNVRELRNAIERAVAFCNGREIAPGHLPERIRKHQGSLPQGGGNSLLADLLPDDQLPSLDDLGNRYVTFVLERLGGNKRRAAQILNISRATLYRRLELCAETDSTGQPAENL
ncbi:DNA-binding transcriptional response regulator, NtrC family, contains REC, AAA-type ATPase, and a Fis-type DNA-binding domains [Geoalkalibacter ferrihydriticus]|uniref:Mutant NtrC activator n=2 Tax=Geoalkalibacter ferrihydriticus TaxID=392333 RepID=A0A0C2HZL0_9BACT|nr:sigma-54 dependent transcriptional regulator [Geoalkalibacter ferrihydriticus]KIH78142.1 mutant NtrC activator [Geoalkalibacter ferrihydriticus DSM 17813]SDM81018.1 DNA-binding transcriptional response regulator, NtrC family, contains REC, AAA-type ATPase, and a Fis-type DNA-binding domains [Geoalkalibacter ferrihydriticus]